LRTQVWDVHDEAAAPQELVSRRDGLPVHGMQCCGDGGLTAPLVAVFGPDVAAGSAPDVPACVSLPHPTCLHR
jgi:hypothetical protein